jgi:hypothetical protein
MDRQYRDWRRASYSDGNAQCAEVGHDVDVIAVRDSKDHDGGALAFTAEVWAAFTASLK